MDTIVSHYPVSKQYKALKQLDSYLNQQRKKHIKIYTNSKQMKELIEKAHPNAEVELIESVS
jgi:hypothetical protein